MVKRQLRRRGISAPTVLSAMGRVAREEFLAPELRHLAYDDSALAIEHGQTISQPFIVALMAEALRLQPTDRVLEVGTGTGYSAAVLSELVREVHTVERHADLAATAAKRLYGMGRSNIQVHAGDGSVGLLTHAPFDAISVTAAGPMVPRALEAQLVVGGRLVVPVGPTGGVQMLVRVHRTSRGLEREDLTEVRFVPLVGDQGWAPGSSAP